MRLNEIVKRARAYSSPFRIDSVDTLMSTPIVKAGQPPQLLANLSEMKRATTPLNISSRRSASSRASW